MKSHFPVKQVIAIKYQWLLEYQKLEEEIDLLKWQIKKAEIELQRWLDPNDLGKVKINNESKSAHLEEHIQELKSFLNEKELSREAFLIMISRFKGLDNQILKMKYVDCKSLLDIAEELNYSYQYIKNKHADIIRTIQFIEEL